MATPHNEAETGQIAKVVLMPGDPLRAKFIADNFLTDVSMFNQVRNMYGYTGMYKNKKVSVMGSGMGMPSIGIYSYELFNVYGVEEIIRIGSAGSYCQEADIYDVILVSSAYSESSYAMTQSGYDKDVTYPDASLNERIKKAAGSVNIPVKDACVHSTDVFYRQGKENYFEDIYREHGCVAVEMESYALFHNAKVLGKKAACLLTISDSFVTNKVTTAKERQESFTNMIEIALEAATE